MPGIFFKKYMLKFFCEIAIWHFEPNYKFARKICYNGGNFALKMVKAFILFDFNSIDYNFVCICNNADFWDI